MITRLARIAAAVSLLLTALGSAQAAAPAGATPLFTLPAASAPMATGTTFDNTFNAAAAGNGWLSLQVQGLKTLDGDNYYIDILNLSVNGSTVLSGTWDLGGGGSDRILANPLGGVVSHNANSPMVNIELPISLVHGQNIVSLTYVSPTLFEGTTRAGLQGLSDEAWSLKALTVSSVSAVPEPGAATLLLAGLAVMGLRQLRRQRG